MLYVYGVVRGDHPAPRHRGVGQPPGDVVLIGSGQLAAAASELPDGFELTDEDARAHLDVLVRLLRDGPVLPLRMGTVAPDETAIRTELLDAGAPQLTDRLDALADVVELHVDADDDESAAIAAIAQTTDFGVAAPVDLADRLELGREVAELLVERRQQLAAQIVGELRPFAVDDVPRSVIRGPEDPVLRWAFLVKRDDVEQFDEAVVAVRAQQPRIEIRYVGPLPPAHFLDRLQDEPTETDPADSFTPEGSWRW